MKQHLHTSASKSSKTIIARNCAVTGGLSMSFSDAVGNWVISHQET